MILKKWLTMENMTKTRFGKKIGRSRSQVHKYTNEGAIPDYEIMHKIFNVTNKAVTPNDFYDIGLEITPTTARNRKNQYEDYKNVKD